MSNNNNSSPAATMTPTTTKDIFLSSEERYQIWCIKKAERPELLEVFDLANKAENEEEEEKKEEHGKVVHDKQDSSCLPTAKHDDKDNSSETDEVDRNNDMLALTDGCDIAAWRRHQFASQGLSFNVVGVLGVGAGCPLLRRDNQLPILALAQQQQHNAKWLDLKKQLYQLLPPSNDEVLLERLEPMVLDYAKDICPLYCHGTRTWRDPAPPFEVASLPALIHGCANDWTARHSMTWKSLVERFGKDVDWRFSDTHGETATLHTYDKYCASICSGQTDDAPLAIYDSQFGKCPVRQCLEQEFTVPSCFAYDLWALVDNEDDDRDSESNDGDDSSNNNNADDDDGDDVVRPPYQWILMGPERSGTGLHVDPIGTHAWVTLLEGCKRWVLFPPDTPNDVIGYDPKGLQIPSVVWFHEWWWGSNSSNGGNRGKVLEKAQQQQEQQPNLDTTNSPPPSPRIRYVEFLQRPGETIYVPAGWPHLVLNLERSVAVTQNYATEYPSFGQFWAAVRREGTAQQQQRLAWALARHRPDLVIIPIFKDRSV